MRSVLLLTALLVLAGCVSTYKQNVVSQPVGRLERGKAVLVGTPKSGSYEAKQYPASGPQTAAAVRAAFARFTNRVAVSPCGDLQCLQAEGASSYDYFVVPEILHWEDRNTEWSGLPDRIEVKLIVLSARSRAEIASAIVSGKSKWATFGGDHPEDLLTDPIERYVGSLY